jgi:hypothetical protein
MSFVRRGINTRVAVAAVVAVAFGALFTGAAGAAVPKAKLLPGGRAIAPPSAPPSVKAMIDAANHIRHRPYVWGGGHRNWNSRGYDCSGSVSYVLHAGGLLEYTLDSTGFMRWGGGGPGSWVRIYASKTTSTRSSPACAGTPPFPTMATAPALAGARRCVRATASASATRSASSAPNR